jgi:hypothetical protein
MHLDQHVGHHQVRRGTNAECRQFLVTEARPLLPVDVGAEIGKVEIHEGMESMRHRSFPGRS